MIILSMNPEDSGNLHAQEPVLHAERPQTQMANGTTRPSVTCWSARLKFCSSLQEETEETGVQKQEAALATAVLS